MKPGYETGGMKPGMKPRVGNGYETASLKNVMPYIYGRFHKLLVQSPDVMGVSFFFFRVSFWGSGQENDCSEQDTALKCMKNTMKKSIMGRIGGKAEAPNTP